VPIDEFVSKRSGGAVMVSEYLSAGWTVLIGILGAARVDNVVIADVETAPPTRMSNAPPSSSATPTSAAVGSDKTKKAVKRPAPLVNVPTSGNGNGMSHPPPQKSARSIAAASGLAELDRS
jgi:hypothetical protein